MIIRIAGLVFVAFLLGTGCKKEKSEVKPIDSTQILPPGKVDQIVVSSGSLFVDTGVTVTIKGQGFDPNMRYGYFLFVKHEDVNLWSGDSILSQEFEPNAIIRDTNLISIDESTIVFRLPKYSIYDVTKDSAFIYFAKHRANNVYYHGKEHKTINAVVSSTKELINTPIYRLLKDTLYINKKYSYLNKEIIQGIYSVYNLKIMVQGLEYYGTSGFFLDNEVFTAPYDKRHTISMVATYDKFYLPDGSYSFEIYERNGNQRKFVEETGKTKIYIKNIP